MKEIVSKYLGDLADKYSRESSSEYSYRREFEELLQRMFETIGVKRIDHDAKSQGGNKPDFVIIKSQIPILYVETKDIGVSLDKAEKSEQMGRYFGYENLVLTDYLEFRFYRNGLPYGEPIKIADYDPEARSLKQYPEKFEYLGRTLIEFTESHKEPIKSGEHLAKIMGGKAQRIRDNIREYLNNGSDKNKDILKIFNTFKDLLVHDLDINSFSDMYAQTVVYGLFVARFYDETPQDFSRQEARDLIPNSNPFLRHFFDHIVGPDFDKRLEYIVNELCEVFSHSDVEKLIEDFYQKSSKKNTTHDPVIHFYEDFLKEYDPKLRKDMGAYYTPTPVVRFMTRSIDHLLQEQFHLRGGLADTSKTDDDSHRVQILDPAVGTGTFISGIIREIYKKFKEYKQEGRWHKYVHNDLLPRLHGFELMMAPYTIAHLKLGMAFKETGFKYFNRRLGIYLTNSLESFKQESPLPTMFGLADSIAQESKQALEIKNNKPIMIVIGNPPYSGESNNAFYSGNNKYKIEPGGKKLKEKNSKWLNDDYVKFFSFAEDMINKTGEGIVAMITSHGYIDNPTFRGMRWHLMNTFDSIYILDLHGNANKKEQSPDGSVDNNVFDIKTGVSIFFGIKKDGHDEGLANVYHAHLYGTRSKKYEYLENESINSVNWQLLSPTGPKFYWTVRDEKDEQEYTDGFAVNELFPISSVGIVTSRDKFVIDEDKNALKGRIQEFLRCESAQDAKNKFQLKENKKWKIDDALNYEYDDKYLTQISYRAFDTRFIYYDDRFIERSRKEVMKNFINIKNVGLVTVNRSPRKNPASYYFLTQHPHANGYIRSDSVSIDTVFPLYVVNKDGETVPNLDSKIVERFTKTLGFIKPEEILAYIYAYLHSDRYRKRFEEFLKTDFARIPYPEHKHQFNQLSSLGSQIQELHLMESSKLDALITTFPERGTDTVEKTPYLKDGKVYINTDQYFGGVPDSVWNFYIGGYQPAQKWLKDRKGKTLKNEDIEHYQKMIVALVETEQIMKEIDDVIGV